MQFTFYTWDTTLDAGMSEKSQIRESILSSEDTGSHTCMASDSTETLRSGTIEINVVGKCYTLLGVSFGGGGGGGSFAPPLKTLCSPWELQPFQIECCPVYARPPKMSSEVFPPPPPLGDFPK